MGIAAAGANIRQHGEVMDTTPISSLRANLLPGYS